MESVKCKKLLTSITHLRQEYLSSKEQGNMKLLAVFFFKTMDLIMPLLFLFNQIIKLDSILFNVILKITMLNFQ